MIVLFILTTSCKDDKEIAIDENQRANEFLNENIGLPAGSFQVSESQITESSTINLTSSTFGTLQVSGGDQVAVSIPFNASDSDVTHAGIRFGTTGDIWMIPIPAAEGNASGTLSFIMEIPPSICQNLSQICHDVKCFEFAVSKDANGNSFKISKGDINELATACGECDLPSCKELLGDLCGIAGSPGFPRFSLSWDGDVDLDLFVTDPLGETISFTNTTSASGGELDVDCTCGGSCPQGQAENIFFTNGPSGTYTYWIDYFADCSSGTTANYTLLVMEGGQLIANKTGSLSSGMTNKFTYIKP